MTAVVHHLAARTATLARLLAVGLDAIAAATQPAPTHIPDWVLRAHR